MLLNSMTCEQDGERLEATVPMLVRAVDNWAAEGISDHPIVIAVATPKSARVLRADEWPDVSNVSCTLQEAAATVIAAVESPPDDHTSQVIVAAVAWLLGATGRTLHGQDAVPIRGRGEVPVLLLMLSDDRTMLATTVAAPRPVLH